MLDNKKELLYEGMRNIGIELSSDQFEQFNNYYNLMIEKNKVMNLTAITNYEDVVIKHFVDSVSIVKVMDMSKINSLIDIGTGAGFPGLPIKIVFPHIQVVLLDSLNKRINFLNEVIDSLTLQRVNTLHARAEDYSRDDKYREQFDICVSRAVANLSTLSEYCLPYVKVGGCVVSYKSEKGNDEMMTEQKGSKLLGGKIKNQTEFTLPGSDIHRNLIVIEKIKSTPPFYPRKAGIPSKEPL